MISIAPRLLSSNLMDARSSRLADIANDILCSLIASFLSRFLAVGTKFPIF
jgi:hypothetical protein